MLLLLLSPAPPREPVHRVLLHGNHYLHQHTTNRGLYLRVKIRKHFGSEHLDHMVIRSTESLWPSSNLLPTHLPCKDGATDAHNMSGRHCVLSGVMSVVVVLECDPWP